MSVLKKKGQDGKTVAIQLKSALITIGRGAECQVVLQDQAAAPLHCQLVQSPQGFVLRDLSTEIGTIVNGKKVAEHVLKEGDVIQIGVEKFVFTEASGVQRASTVAIKAPTAAIKLPTVAIKPPTAAIKPPTVAVKPSTTAIKPPTIAVKPPTVAIKPATTVVKPVTSVVKTSPPTSVTQRGLVKPPTTTMPQGNGVSPTAGRSKTTIMRGGVARPTTKTSTLRKGPGTLRYNKDRTFFALPSTRKGKLIALGVFGGLGAVVAVLLIIKSGQVDPEKIKAEMTAEVERLNKMPDEEIIKKDEAIHGLLENEQYKKYAGDVRKPLERAHGQIHELAKAQKDADNEVKPFFARYDAAKQNSEQYRQEAPKLWDESKSLRDRFSTTVYGEKLTGIVKDLSQYLEEMGGDTAEKSFFSMTYQADQSSGKGDFVKAFEIVETFATKYHEGENPELKKKLEEFREKLHRLASAHVEKILRRARDLQKEGKKEEAAALIQNARPGLGKVTSLTKFDEFLKENK